MAATDHTAQRAPRGRGRRVRRRVRRQCAAPGQAAGSLIPHARAMRPLVIAMIETPFGAPAMAAAGVGDRSPARDGPTRRGAVGVAAITRNTHRERAVTEAADLLPKGYVHVGAAARSDWTQRSNRGTKDDCLGLSEHRGGHRGSGGAKLQALTASTRPTAYAASAVQHNSQRTTTKRLWTLPQPYFFFRRPETKNNYTTVGEIRAVSDER